MNQSPPSLLTVLKPINQTPIITIVTGYEVNIVHILRPDNLIKTT